MHAAGNSQSLLFEESTSGPFTTQYEPASSPADVAVTDCCPLPEPYATSWLCRWWLVPMCCSLMTVPQVTCAGDGLFVIEGLNFCRGVVGVGTISCSLLEGVWHSAPSAKRTHHCVVVRGCDS